MNSITFAGHAAVIINSEGKIIGIDPWLMGNPACPEPLKNMQKLDLICLTHGHGDHAGDAVELHKKHNCPIAATWDLCSALNESGVSEDKLHRLNLGGEIELNDLGISVALTVAFHSSNFIRPDGIKVVAGDAAGVVVKSRHATIYHAGDTALFSDIALIAERHAPGIGLFPIGDRVTMGPKEAAKAAKLSGVKVAIPIHFDTFPIFTGKASTFEQECKKLGVNCHVMNPGQTTPIRELL
jgi:L-ascorbate metabolism protein UlaG (beta-lactamase superfamily)